MSFFSFYDNKIKKSKGRKKHWFKWPWNTQTRVNLPHVVNLFNLLFLFTHAILLQYHLRSTVSGISITDLNIVSI